MRKFSVLILVVFLVMGMSFAVYAQHDHSSMQQSDSSGMQGKKGCGCKMAMMHGDAHAGHGQAAQDMKSCKYCGMDREVFAHTAMLINYEDGTTVGTCSIHCAAIDLSINIGKSVKSIQVGDYNTKKLIDAEKAFWVIGGSKQGVMTKNAKWAFENKTDAESFVKANGGKLSNFDDALKTTYSDMYDDTKMIRDKRKSMKQEKTMEHKHVH
jgi:nitrous oxide reductase accessory protein NosL